MHITVNNTKIIEQLENIGSHIDMQTHARNGCR